MGADMATTPSRTPRRWLVVATVGLMVVTFAQRFGEIIYLFRIDRVLDPLRMAARSLELWNPWWDMGSVQVQTVGYWWAFRPGWSSASSSVDFSPLACGVASVWPTRCVSEHQ
jgi:hypothetical protein